MTIIQASCCLLLSLAVLTTAGPLDPSGGAVPQLKNLLPKPNSDSNATSSNELETRSFKFIPGFCTDDSQCRESQFCADNNLDPFVANTCQNDKALGGICGRDAQCQSGHCDGTRCGECTLNSDCPAHQYCKNNDVPLVINRCTNKLPHAAWCTEDQHCTSGFCDGARCGECAEDRDCRSTQFCKFKNYFGVANVCVTKKCKGWCSRDAECQSGVCKAFRCKKTC